MRPGSVGHSVQTMIAPPNQWSLVKSFLLIGIACGILGATIGPAFQALNGARLAAMIGGVPLAIIGSLAMGWYGFLFGSVNRLRFGEMLGLVLGLLVGGLIGSVCGLIVLTLPRSLVGALIGRILGSNLTAHHRPSLRPFFGTVLGVCGGIIVLAFQRDQDHARIGAIYSSLIGGSAGIGALLALICALNLMPKMHMD
jgi:phage shock protein PspC (stress-responsive transcriptional regulator)